MIMESKFVTEKGVFTPTLIDSAAYIGDALTQAVGPVNLEPDSVAGQWVGIEAEANALHFEALGECWSSRFLSSATGVALDAMGFWIGEIRKPPTKTRVNSVLYGSEGALVPAGSYASFDNYQFRLEEASVISRALLVDGEFRVADTSQPAYTVRVSGADLTYTKSAGDTASDIATGLATLVNETEIYQAIADGSAVKLTTESRVQGYPVSFVGVGLEWVKIGSPGIFAANEFGAIDVPVGALDNPVSAIVGWTGVANLVAGSTGSARESDEDYRSRLYASRASQGGAATVEAIKQRLNSEVAGVTRADVLENDTMEVDADGLPPKSIKCVVQGGIEQDIADAIWKYKGAGIETFGSIPITVADSFGRAHLIRFSRPETVTVRYRVTVSLLEPEEVLPPDVVSGITTGVLAYADTLGIGSDVVAQRALGFIYRETTGIGKMEVEVSADGITWTEDILPIPAGGSASILAENIEVIGV